MERDAALGRAHGQLYVEREECREALDSALAEVGRLQESCACLRDQLRLEREGNSEALSKGARKEIMRLMREDFDPTPPNWEGRDWYDNAEDVAAKIIAVAQAEKPTHVSDAWGIIKRWLADFTEEETTFSRYGDNVMIDGVMVAVEVRQLRAFLAGNFVDLAHNVGGTDDRLLVAADINTLRTTMREWIGQARASLDKARSERQPPRKPHQNTSDAWRGER